jgi:hypothetical protein
MVVCSTVAKVRQYPRHDISAMFTPQGLATVAARQGEEVVDTKAGA